MRNQRFFFFSACVLGMCIAASVAMASWVKDPVLGNVWESGTGWSYHAVHGWFWKGPEGSPSHTLFSPRWGWLSYSSDSYPNSWSHNWRTWYGPETIDQNDAWTYDYWAGAWYAASDTPLQRVQRRLPAIMSHAQVCIDDTTTRLNPAQDTYPDYTGINGAYGDWLVRPSTWWSAGFFPALLWLNAGYTGESSDRQTAALWTTGLFSEITNTNQFDMGFLVGLPFRRAFELTGESTYRDGIHTACNALNTRFSDVTNAVRHWTFGIYGRDPNFTVIIDSLLNMEMLYWGSSHDGNPVWAQHAASHAETLGTHNVRENGSTYHWVIFDENDGTLLDKGTHQGYADESTWSRGQAWAIYGFSVAYRETGDTAFLELARRVTDYFLASLPDDWIPPADFDDPAGLEAAAKDSAAAAVAASGLWILAGLDPDENRADRYAEAAGQMLLRLSHPDYLSTEVDSESILLQGSPRFGDNNRGTTFGDYYFVEALLRWGGNPLP